MQPTAVPRIFRFLVGARDLVTSQRFYERLLGVAGKEVAEGRVYFDCGSAILGVLDLSKRPPTEWQGTTEAIYFATADLEDAFRRARELDCLAPGLLHEDPASPLGQIVVRPWGERSFYAEDPSGNSLCFVDETTLFTGTRAQIAALSRRSKSPST